jgi:hypothetical protein
MSPAQNINDRKIIIILFKHKRTMVWGIYLYRREEGLVEYVAVLHKRSFLHNYLPFQLDVHGSKHVVQRCF